GLCDDTFILGRISCDEKNKGQGSTVVFHLGDHQAKNRLSQGGVSRNVTLKKLAYNLAEKRNGAGNLAFEELEDVIAGPCEEDVWELTERYCETDVDWDETKITYFIAAVRYGLLVVDEK
ncbi:MAG: hypothetical protein IJ567_06485, partial [Lachnospiraceae bacterium]|nr:hypothetical protein [Lachnospiraceae bacterium]